MNPSKMLKTNETAGLTPWYRLLDDVFNIRQDFDVQGFGTGWIPAVDVEEKEDEYRFFAEMPGMKREDVKITLSENVLTITGEKKTTHKSNDKKYHRLERSYGTFQRSFSLPHLIQADKISATVKDGILEIVVPKSEEAKPREISVT
jgi:HSP20 family protein